MRALSLYAFTRASIGRESTAIAAAQREPRSQPASTIHRSDICGSESRADQDGATLRCLIRRGHEGTHQAYFRDHLHEWADAHSSESDPEPYAALPARSGGEASPR